MAERKRILMVSTSYPENAEDWRGRFIADMAQSMADRQELALSLWAPPGEHPHDVTDATTPADKKWLQSLLAQGGIACQLRNNKITGLKLAAGLLARLYRTYHRESPDLVHVNWLQNALPLWGTKTPALITVLGNDYGLLSKPGMTFMLRAVFRQRPTILAPNAAWMVSRLEELFGDVAKIITVPFGVDRRWFAIDRTDVEPGCWLAITRITRNKIGDLFTWGEGLFENRKLHLFGPMQEQIDLPAWVTWHGPTHPAELRETWFPKASGLITLSRHDEGRPQVMLEAMAAGLPVIASNLPAHQDFVRHRETGWLVNNRKELAPALATLEDMKNNHTIGEAAQRRIKQTIGDWDDCASRYAALYNELDAF
ncbi:MAG: glycosyltransferase family 4 protein [Candidatus Sedimenticola sp. (ex Thyasira tokunagai)]